MPTLKNSQNNSTQELTVNCPHCQKKVIWNTQQKYKPFCSERCKLIDLGEWAAEEKVIPGESINLEQENDFDPFLH